MSELLRQHAWKRLARFYDVAPSSAAEAELESGWAFRSAKSPGSPEAAAMGEYTQPFIPGSRYVSTAPTDDPSVVEVTVELVIDQGGGVMQRGIQMFRMRHTGAGYQLILPSAPAGAPATFDYRSFNALSARI